MYKDSGSSILDPTNINFHLITLKFKYNFKMRGLVPLSLGSAPS